MSKANKNFNLLLSTLMAMIVLSACSLHEPTRVTQNQIQAVKGHHEEMVDFRALDENARRHLAQDFEKFGNSPLDIMMTFNPSSRVTTASKARHDLNHLVADLQRHGARNIRADLMPVNDGTDYARVMISYASVSAAAPKDCPALNGLDNREISVDDDYRFGCGRDTIFARQIAKPKHLLGNDNDSGLSEGRRAANTVEAYRTGVPNAALGGESSTGG